MSEESNDRPTMSRRDLLQDATLVAAAGAITLGGSTALAGEPVAKNRRIKQSLVQWCYAKYWNLDEMCQVAKKLGCESIELVAPEDWPTLRKHGLTCAISPSHLFMQGMNNPKYHDPCIELLKTRIDQAAASGVKTVITFTGYAEEMGPWANGNNPDVAALPANRPVVDPVQGAKNCVEGFKRVVGYAEAKGINLAIEMLNTRVSDHPMKGHPGYQGDHIDYCMEIIRKVGSLRLGLLFDLYHVQIMDGDLINRIRACGESIMHVHTAGNPGRAELDDTQEINYPPCLRALLEIGYKGYVGQEFIPTRDPLAGLTEAVKLCDV